MRNKNQPKYGGGVMSCAQKDLRAERWIWRGQSIPFLRSGDRNWVADAGRVQVGSDRKLLHSEGISWGKIGWRLRDIKGTMGLPLEHYRDFYGYCGAL